MLHIIVNPAGASGKTAKAWQSLEPLFQESLIPYRLHYSTMHRSITQIVAALTRPGRICQDPYCKVQDQNYPMAGVKDRSGEGRSAAEREQTEDPSLSYVDIVVVGGDGTFNEAVNGICDLSRVRLGLIPGGSGNDLLKGLGLGSDAELAARLIITNLEKGNYGRMEDVGQAVLEDVTQTLPGALSLPDPGTGMVTRRFLDSCGIGFDAAVCERSARSSFKKVLNQLGMGRLIYILNAIHMVFFQKNPSVTVSQDGELQTYPNAFLAVVMNHTYEGGGFMFCPAAVGDDGMLNICIANPKRSNLPFFPLFPRAYKGDHVDSEIITVGQGREYVLAADSPQWVHTDGEVCYKASKMTLTLLDHQLMLLV